MSLAAGTRLGPYEITAAIGAGGMGEVYRARDTKLKRDVALKVLPNLVASDPDRLARFHREAEVLAALNHPNIAHIYGVEDSSSTHALVMELVEGPTLAEMLAGSRLQASGSGSAALPEAQSPTPKAGSPKPKAGGLPLEDALKIGRQIAEALEAAHEQGIIHRDLKPANIKVREDGTVKVLDFGLAKAMEPVAASSPGLSMSPTITTPAMTQAGMILGTAAYMSPEQASGKLVDKRADIWSFGVVLWEMLTGRRLFDGETVSHTLADVLRGPIDFNQLPTSAPKPIRDLLRRCLTRDVKKRLRDMGEARIQIEDALSGAGEDAASPIGSAPTAHIRRSMLWVVIGVTAMLAAIITSAAVRTLRPSGQQTSTALARVTVTLPAGDELGLALDGPALALSLDGATLVYVGRHNNTQQLYVRPLDSMEAKALPGTDGALFPFFPPDGQWIGFFAEGKLKKAAVAGGVVQVLADAPSPRGGSWGPDNVIYFAPTSSNVSGLWKVSAAGGAASQVTKLDRAKGEISHRWPQLLPGGRALLFTVWTGPGADERRVEALILQTGERRVLAQGADTGRYVSTGHLVYANAAADAIMAVPMDLDGLDVSSAAPVVLAEPVRAGGEGAQYAVSDAGHLVYLGGGPQRLERRLVWTDRRGNIEALPAPPRQYDDVTLSPDGRLAALSTRGKTTEIWIYEFARSTLTRLNTSGSIQAPVWSPDGTRVAYRATRSGSRNLFWKSVDDTSPEERLTTGELTETPSSFSPDGKLLAFSRPGAATGIDIWVMPVTGERKSQGVIVTTANQLDPQFSPNGRWLAYMSNDSGRDEVYVQPYPGPGRKWLISTDGGNEPRWSRNGRELFYRNGDKFMAVGMNMQPPFSAGSPRLLFQGRGRPSVVNTTGFDVSLDGQRFLMAESVESQSRVTQIEVVMNWFTELRRGVPITR